MRAKALELAGVLVASTITNLVLDLAVRRSQMTFEAWAVSAVVPLALLLVYWFWIEPRHERTRVRQGRYRTALEDALVRGYKADPRHVISDDGLMFEGASDPYRKGRYEELGLADLFVPDPRKGQSILTAKGNEGAALLERAQRGGITPDLEQDLLRWERLAGKDVAFYQRGLLRKGQAIGFTKHSFSKEPDERGRLRRIEQEIAELRMYAGDQAQLSREQAERNAGHQ